MAPAGLRTFHARAAVGPGAQNGRRHAYDRRAGSDPRGHHLRPAGARHQAQDRGASGSLWRGRFAVTRSAESLVRDGAGRAYRAAWVSGRACERGRLFRDPVGAVCSGRASAQGFHFARRQGVGGAHHRCPVSPAANLRVEGRR